jgi:glycosyltransferase involved in cell wall biosynthesis
MEASGLRILQLADHAEILSGGAVQMVLLSRGLRALGHDVTCVFDDRAGPHEESLGQVTRAGLRLVRVPMDKRSDSPPLRQFVAGGHFDIVHTHRASYKVLLRSCADLQLPPVVVNRGQSRPLRDAERRRMQHPAVRAHVVVAEHIRDLLIEAGISPARITVVYGSYDPERFHPAVDGGAVRREWLGEEAETAPLVGIVAKLSEYKSHDVFLGAAARLLQHRPEVQFAVVGPDPEGMRLRLEVLARELEGAYGVPLGSHLRFTGPRQDVPAVLAALDVSVSASATPWEGLSGVMRESLAMARPVVCTDVGGNRELVRDGETGRLVPAGDPAALAAAIEDLLAHPERARSLAGRGLRLVREKFSNEARARTVEALYRRLCAESGPGN